LAKTWAKVNKNGTRDKRFKSNYQIPVVRYGNIRLSTQTGLREEYEFSNYELTEEFGMLSRPFNQNSDRNDNFLKLFYGYSENSFFSF
jgi:hypothetical protein